MKKYNLDKLVKVECNDFWESRWYKFKKEKKFLGLTLTKKGFYSTVTNCYLGLEIPKHHTMLGGFPYENPEVILHYQGGHLKKYFFGSISEAKKFTNEITEKGRWID